jgi:hypothetical protein
MMKQRASALRDRKWHAGLAEDCVTGKVVHFSNWQASVMLEIPYE